MSSALHRVPPHAPPHPPASPGEVDLSAAQFREISRLVVDIAGIQLREGKEGLVRSRLAKRLRQLGLASYDAYLERVRTDASGAELAEMIDLLTTNKTNFFREPAHFDVVEERVVPEFGDAPGGLRIWSAGCSSGEEPYTLAMVLKETMHEPALRQARILATDISHRVLAKARAAEYTREQTDGVSDAQLRAHFTPTASGGVAVRPELRAMVAFAPLNLMGPWPMRGPFHAIFCRNVMIYFDKPTQQRLVARYHELLVPGGYLFVGHSESLGSLGHGYTYLQPAVYRK